MVVSNILTSVTCISFFQLALIAYFNPGKVNPVANNWFGLFSFSAGCMMLNAFIYQAGAEANYKELIAFNELSRFLIAPALFLSVRHFTSPDKGLKALDYLHFIPFLLFLIYMLPYLIVTNYNLSNTSGYLPGFIKLWWPFLLPATLNFQLLCYWAMAYNNLKQHQKNIRLINAATNEINLKWLQYLLYGIALMLIISIAGSVFKPGWIAFYSPIFYLAGVLITGYFLIAQKEVYPFEQPELEEISEIIRPTNNAGTKTVRFPKDKLDQLKTQLGQLMTTDKPYLDNELSLPDLAKLMDISTHDLSFVLNEGFGLSFFGFVNSYRITEVKQLMLSGQYKQLNMLGIAYSAGFNSKTTFNTAFKKETGLSPTQFIQTLKADSSQVTTVKR
ncbi:MAG: helix-turn-helix domain-containing protein [Mucilaginibacter sp.]|uniref:helix-turn-helix domain-containing protein n=1 Tax=Mucilaginibacter sp. TaxID=1882438 RepID=UPI0034E5081E